MRARTLLGRCGVLPASCAAFHTAWSLQRIRTTTAPIAKNTWVHTKSRPTFRLISISIYLVVESQIFLIFYVSITDKKEKNKVPLKTRTNPSITYARKKVKKSS